MITTLSVRHTSTPRVFNVSDSSQLDSALNFGILIIVFRGRWTLLCNHIIRIRAF